MINLICPVLHTTSNVPDFDRRVSNRYTVLCNEHRPKCLVPFSHLIEEKCIFQDIFEKLVKFSVSFFYKEHANWSNITAVMIG